MNNDIPTFTPPAPTFTPPEDSTRRRSGNTCYYHENEEAVAKCAKCGKPICQDCYDNYGVSTGEYEGEALCYDCCKQIVSQNVKNLKKQRGKIIRMYIFTIIGMIFGGIIGGSITASDPTVPGWIPVLTVFIGGCLWTFIVNVFKILGNTIKNISNGAWLGAIFWFFIDMIKAIFLAVWGTIQKIFYYTKHLIKTSGFIKSDSNAVQQMKEYMEYSMVRSRNVGVDLATLMNEGSELYNNSYARAVAENGEEKAESMLRNAVATINENGEIIRSFAG